MREATVLILAPSDSISLETVRRHRKAIYRKPDVSSQADLFALFINTIPFVAKAQDGDPLELYGVIAALTQSP